MMSTTDITTDKKSSIFKGFQNSQDSFTTDSKNRPFRDGLTLFIRPL